MKKYIFLITCLIFSFSFSKKKELRNANKKFNTGFRSLFEELTVGLEIFNMFDGQNSITNTWVRDVYSKRQFSIPNYLTPRIFNLNLEFKF